MLGKDTAFSLKQGNLYRDFIAFSMLSPCFGTSSWQYFRRMVLHRKGLSAKRLPMDKRAEWLVANTAVQLLGRVTGAAPTISPMNDVIKLLARCLPHHKYKVIVVANYSPLQ